MQQVREKTGFYQISMRDVRDTALAEGHEQGLEQGIEQGLEQGIEQGLAEGAKNNAYKTATRLIRRGASNKDIQEITELPLDKIVELKEKVAG